MRMDNLEIEERPLAVGYFLLDTLRSLFMAGIAPADHICISVGLMSEEEIATLQESGVNVFTAPKPIDDLAPLYKLLVQVSRGDEDSE